MLLFLSVWMAFEPSLVVAQDAAAGGSIQVEVERQRITLERSQHQAVFLQAAQACYARFAVSDCLRQVRLERRTLMDELRRQELLLNDMDRQAKAIAELNRIQDNVSAQEREQLERQKELVPKTQ